MRHPPSHAAELAGAGSAAAPGPIAPLPTAVTAFIGRTLKGPLDTPTAIAGFADYRRLFGGLWQAAPLRYAGEEVFEHGGGAGLIGRVANGARPPSLGLPGGGGVLRLRALAPGTREYLRASVDYDGIPAGAE